MGITYKDSGSFKVLKTIIIFRLYKNGSRYWENDNNDTFKKLRLSARDDIKR